MANVFITPNRVIIGNEALALSGPNFVSMGKKALIVSDDMMVKIGNTDKVIEVLNKFGIEYEIYSEINSEPCDYMIDEGAKIFNKSGCDFIIAVGGGSPIDSMKAIAASVKYRKSINEFMGEVVEGKLVPMAAVPTTAGTGSEATQFTIINNTKENIKMLLKGPAFMVDLAIIDPVFTLTVPPNVTAATGLDALCHAVEAYTSVKAFPMTDTMALAAVKKIFDNLYLCYKDGTDRIARENMALAALEAGMAFNNSSVTIIHGMSRPIGALYHVPHGLSNAMLLDKCLRFAVSGCVDRFRNLAECIGVYKQGMNETEGAEAFIAAVSELCRKLNIQTLEEYGIDRETFFESIEKMADDAIASGSPANTRRTPSKEEIIEIYKSLY